MNKHFIFKKIESFQKVFKENLQVKKLVLILIVTVFFFTALLILLGNIDKPKNYLDLLSQNTGEVLPLSAFITKKGVTFDRPIDFSTDLPNNTLYILNKGGFITIIDTVEYFVVNKIYVGKSPKTILFNPNVRKIYVSTKNSGVIIIDLKDETIKTAPVRSDIKSIALNTVDNKLYILNQVGNEMLVLDGLTDTIISRIELGVEANNMSILKLPYMIYVSSIKGKILKFVDGNTGEVVLSKELGFIPTFLFPSISASNLYVAGKDPNTVAVFNVLTGKETTQVYIAASPRYSLLSKDENTLYVANSLLDEGNLSVVDTNDWSTRTVVDIKGTLSSMEESLDKIFILNSMYATVSVLDKKTDDVLDTVDLPNFYNLMYLHKEEGEGRLTLISRLNEVIELDTSTMVVVKRLGN
ncbi:YncE family protein [Candidatus Kaiserbacteria bacterium]|nr:YncE family protein [Candidatus Kaiserbacteria bacterium]